MSTIAAAGSPFGSSTQSDAPLRGLNMDDFLKLFITELRNQDPLNPMENSEILTQIGQIREIEATERLTRMLDSLLAGQNASLLSQNLASAGALIGRHVQGQARTVTELGVEFREVAGVVDRVSIEDGQPILHVGEYRLEFANIRSIAAGAAQAEPPSGDSPSGDPPAAPGDPPLTPGAAPQAPLGTAPLDVIAPPSPPED